jgi:iron complex outermembrane receptor protein
MRSKNAFDLSETAEMLYGVDFSKRNWDGAYIGEGNQAPIDGFISIDDVDTENRAIFAEIDKDYNNFNLRAGARYDDTKIDPAGNLSNEPSNDYSALSGFLFGTYQANNSTKLFGGLGQASRVPDARELYFRGAMINMGMPMNPQLGTPTLDQTTNTEIDFGMENSFANLHLKTKLFYSWLTDFIVYNADKKMNRFENVDATIYGLDFSGSYYATDDVYFDFGLAYQRGKKDQPLEGQTGTNLPEIPPLKLNLALSYDYVPNSYARIELVAADDWDRFDDENGEQFLDNYAVLNLKVKHDLTKGFEITAGVDNVFNETYAVSNTYKDLTLLTDGTTDEVILMNEPGRYYYLNGTYRF